MAIDFVFDKIKPPWDLPRAQQPIQLVAFPTTLQGGPKIPSMTRYDTHSFPIRIDNHSSYCVTNNKRDFVGPLEPLHANVKGIRGTVNVRYKGTVRWQWEDDFGRTTAHYIPDTIYMPSSPDQILSPQHWSQNKVQDRDDSAHVMTNHTSVILSWNQGKHVKTVPLNMFTNVAVMHSCPNFRTALRAYPSVVVSDNEDNEDNKGQTTSVFGIPLTAPRRSYHLEDDIPEDITQSPRPITFD